MGDDPSGCREWEENIYWSHFQSFQFVLILPSSFDQQMAIPQKFVKNLREKLAGTISLRGPSGGLWNVEVTAAGAGGAGGGDETLCFKQGWKAFVEDHSLEENDVLIFKYTGSGGGGDSSRIFFDVLMFDKQSLCEKEASYFVRRCSTDVGCKGCKRKKETTFQENFEVTKESSSHDPTNDDDDVPLKMRRKTAANAGSSKKRTITPYKLELTSKRRLVTVQEKEKALQKAHAASSEDSFMVIMQPSHVYKIFYMSMPLEWLKKHLPQKSRNLILRCNGREWSVTFLRKHHNNGGLTVGWRKFVLDNFLEESDVCLFKPADKKSEAMVFKVSIFRVVDEVTPPCPANPVMPSNGRAKCLAAYFSNSRAKMN